MERFWGIPAGDEEVQTAAVQDMEAHRRTGRRSRVCADAMKNGGMGRWENGEIR